MDDAPAGPRVALFATCIGDAMQPQSPIAVVRLLERLGCTVEFPEAQTCCGQMFTNTGYFPEAMPAVHAFLEAFEDYEYIVAASGSCVGSVREQHPMLAARAGDEALRKRVENVAARTLDISEFLVDVLGTVDVGAYFPHRVTYHPTCHSLRVTRVGDRPYRLLQAVRGLELVGLEDAERCCGFGGTFAVKNPDVSVAMAADKARHVADTGAEYLIAGDGSCLLNIGGILSRDRTGVQPISLVEVLASTEATTEEAPR